MKQWLALGVLVALAHGRAWAHKLEVTALPRPGWLVQVDCWFETGDSPAGARVQVLDAAGHEVTAGTVDERGLFAFRYVDTAPLRIVVNAGAGHREETRLTREVLTRQATCTVVAGLAASPWEVAALVVPIDQGGPAPTLEPAAARATGPQWLKLGLGAGVLLAIAALMLLRGQRSTPSPP